MDLREAGVVEVAEPRHRLECQFIDDAINDDAFIDVNADNFADDDVIGVVRINMG